jgi:hypothetical protein
MTTTQTKSDAETRLERAKAKASKPAKSKFGLKTQAPSGDQKPVSAPATADVSQAKSGDQSDVKPAKVKKPRDHSPTYKAWKTIKNFPAEAKISLIATGNPKRRDAARRFDFYKEGMTVAEYLAITKENGITNTLANADIRWDHAAGFIKVEVK